jgi:hypothetical protein
VRVCVRLCVCLSPGVHLCDTMYEIDPSMISVRHVTTDPYTIVDTEPSPCTPPSEGEQTLAPPMMYRPWLGPWLPLTAKAPPRTPSESQVHSFIY